MGDTGPQGKQGKRGPAGFRGINGTQGPFGDQGAEGKQGIAGLKGAIGPKGYDGPQGDDGPQGPEGLKGPQGFKGDTGPLSSSILQGDSGMAVKGATGVTGNTGIQGNIGPSGLRGDTGPQGFKGDTGVTFNGQTGQSGIKGPTGIKGPNGPNGPTGIVGSTGIQGPTGISATFGNNPIFNTININKDLKKTNGVKWVGLGLRTANYKQSINYSTDGVNWLSTNQTSIIFSNFNIFRYKGIGGVAFGNNIWVAGSIASTSNNVIIWSSDGINWNPSITCSVVPYDNTYYVTNVTFGNGIWVAGSDVVSTYNNINNRYKCLHWSLDGSNWNLGNSYSVSGVITTVAYNNNLWHAFSKIYQNPSLNIIMSSNDAILYSSNGINWYPSNSISSITSFNTDTFMYSSTTGNIAYGNGIWVAGCAGFLNTKTTSMVYSTNGSDWNPVLDTTLVNNSSTLSFVNIVFNNNLWVAITNTNIFWSSSGSNNWNYANVSSSNIYFTNNVAGYKNSAIYYNDGLWTISGNNFNFNEFSEYYNTIISPDGSNWVVNTKSNTPGSNSANLFTVAYADNTSPAQITIQNKQNLKTVKWVGINLSNRATNPKLKYSTDGFNWITNNQILFSPSRGNGGVAFGNNMWVAGSFASTSINALIWSSDGINWNPSVTSSVTPYSVDYEEYKVNSVEYGNSIWVAGSINFYLTGSNDCLHWSLDGSNWNLGRSVARGGSIISIKYNNNLWHALSRVDTDNHSNFSILYSSDGIFWNASRSLNINPNRFNNGFMTGANTGNIAYGNGLWVAVCGNQDTSMVYSTNGSDWDAVIEPGGILYGPPFIDIAFNNNLWVAITTNLIFWSSNGSNNWNYANVSPSNFNFGRNYGNNNIYKTACIYYNNGLWSITGNNSGNQSYFNLITSTDGSNWDNSNHSNTPGSNSADLFTVAYGDIFLPNYPSITCGNNALNITPNLLRKLAAYS